MFHNAHHDYPDTTNGPKEEIESRRQQLNVVTQETRFVLIQNILSHPEQLPTLKELDYVNPSKSKSTIREHLEVLIENGVVEERTLPKDERKRDLPWTFYGLTEEGRDLLDEFDLLGAEGTLQDMYEMLETTAEIKKYADAPRPNKESEPDLKEETAALADYIRGENPDAETIQDQIAVAKMLYEAGIGPENEGKTTNEIAESIAFSHSSQTAIQNLVAIDILEESQHPEPSTYVISERRDEIINGEVEATIEAEMENLIDHMVTHMDDQLISVDDVHEGDQIALPDGAGPTIRSILATEFDIQPSDVEDYLREGDRLKKLNAAVDAIEESEGVQKKDNYGRIVFRRSPRRYRLTEFAVDLAT
ncbi:winged helix-turn-helix domain-containing protein (plasmid) [Halorientalis pallida]|uniref:winged helix-turn-helix domain-containing protein n=1 Tax=Halorientalis pallida TaxID=2479928 RepID=UPI003C6F1F5A